MRRLAPPLCACLAFALSLPAQEGDQLDADIRMFTVMAALNAAGYDDGAGARGDSLVRQAVRVHLESFQGETRTLLQNAYNEYKLDDPDANLSQWVSFALMCEPPPTFELKAELPTDLPEEVRKLRAFSTILERFYHEADIESLWRKYQPAYGQELDRYQAALAPMLFKTAGYLRISNQSREFAGFRVWIDQLGAPDALNSRLWGGNMQVVAHPAETIHLDEIRHAFLLHLLDRLSIRYRGEVSQKEVLSRFALFAPALEEAYKTDFELLVTKCLAKAIDIRLDRAPAEEKTERANQAMVEGYILTPYFFEALPGFEADSRDINKYYPDLISAIDLKKEAARLQNVKFVEPAARPKREAPAAPQLSEVDKILKRGEFLLNEEMLDEARAAFEEAKQKSGGTHAQASYGLARVAIMEADPDLARENFTEVSETAADPHLKAMAHIYIGRIEDVVGNREQAVMHYKLALDSGDPSQRTRDLAEQGISSPFRRPQAEQEQEP
jgi:tetratricopeptide (TPR) repeat protein